MSKRQLWRHLIRFLPLQAKIVQTLLQRKTLMRTQHPQATHLLAHAARCRTWWVKWRLGNIYHLLQRTEVFVYSITNLYLPLSHSPHLVTLENVIWWQSLFKPVSSSSCFQ